MVSCGEWACHQGFESFESAIHSIHFCSFQKCQSLTFSSHLLYVTGCSNIRFLDLGVNFVQACHMGRRIQILEIRFIIKIMHIVPHKF